MHLAFVILFLHLIELPYFVIMQYSFKDLKGFQHQLVQPNNLSVCQLSSQLLLYTPNAFVSYSLFQTAVVVT